MFADGEHYKWSDTSSRAVQSLRGCSTRLRTPTAGALPPHHQRIDTLNHNGIQVDRANTKHSATTTRDLENQKTAAPSLAGRPMESPTANNSNHNYVVDQRRDKTIPSVHKHVRSGTNIASQLEDPGLHGHGTPEQRLVHLRPHAPSIGPRRWAPQYAGQPISLWQGRRI